MNIQHPYGYPVAIALLSIAAFFLICAYREVDSLIEDRRNRRLDQDARTEEIRQRLQAAADRMNADRP